MLKCSQIHLLLQAAAHQRTDSENVVAGSSVSQIEVRITYQWVYFDFIMGLHDNSTETENVGEDGGYIKVTNSLVESNYLCALGPKFLLIFVVRDFVMRVKRVEMMNHYKVRTW